MGPARGPPLPYLYYNRMANVGKFIIVQVYYSPFTPVLTEDLSVFNTKIAREAKEAKGLLIKINDKSASQTLLNDNGSLKCTLHK